MMAATYGLVLFAMTMTENVSLVVALRQVSIIFGVVMGIYFLKEKSLLKAIPNLCFPIQLLKRSILDRISLPNY